MELNLQQERQQTHALVDLLPAEKLNAVRNLLEVMVDEPVMEEDRQRFQEGQDWFAQRGGKGIPMEAVLAEFGLKPEDFPLNK